MIQLSDLQRDALGEVFNIGVGRAAAGLSMIVNQEVNLSAPIINLLPPAEVQKALLGGMVQNFSVVSQEFSGPFTAKAIIIFAESNALTIVSQMFGEEVSPDELSEYEQEAMCEVGNIILNACLSALADLFSVSINGSLPEHQFCDSKTIRFSEHNGEQAVLVLQVNMSISQAQIEGHMIFVLSVDSLQGLLDCLEQYLQQQGLCA